MSKTSPGLRSCRTTAPPAAGAVDHAAGRGGIAALAELAAGATEGRGGARGEGGEALVVAMVSWKHRNLTGLRLR